MKSRKVKKFVIVLTLIISLLAVQTLEITVMATNTIPDLTNPSIIVSNLADLQNAIDTASDGAVIGIDSIIPVYSECTLGSADGSKHVYIVRMNADAYIYLGQSNNLTICNITLDGNGSQITGNNPMLYVNGTLNLNNSVIQNCAGVTAGAVYVTNYGVLNATATNFENNSAVMGGHIENYGSTTLNGCSLKNGSAQEMGGAISNGYNVTIENCKIVGNHAGLIGGAIHNGEILSISQSVIYGNTAIYGNDIANNLNYTAFSNDNLADVLSLYEAEGVVPVEWRYDGPATEEEANQAGIYGFNVLNSQSLMRLVLEEENVGGSDDTGNSGTSGDDTVNGGSSEGDTGVDDGTAGEDDNTDSSDDTGNTGGDNTGESDNSGDTEDSDTDDTGNTGNSGTTEDSDNSEDTGSAEDGDNTDNPDNTEDGATTEDEGNDGDDSGATDDSDDNSDSDNHDSVTDDSGDNSNSENQDNATDDLGDNSIQNGTFDDTSDSVSDGNVTNNYDQSSTTITNTTTEDNSSVSTTTDTYEDKSSITTTTTTTNNYYTYNTPQSSDITEKASGTKTANTTKSTAAIEQKSETVSGISTHEATSMQLPDNLTLDLHGVDVVYEIVDGVPKIIVSNEKVTEQVVTEQTVAKATTRVLGQEQVAADKISTASVTAYSEKTSASINWYEIVKMLLLAAILIVVIYKPSAKKGTITAVD